MKSFIMFLIHNLLKIPIIFHYQQKLCNDYSRVYNEFSEYFECKNCKILEIGCSTAMCSSQIIDMNKHTYYGIDISERYISAAKVNAPFGNFIVMDARKLTFDDNSFDIIIFNGVVHHLDDELFQKCLIEVKRVLKADGNLLISEPIFDYKNWISTKLLQHDRGEFIRTPSEYRSFLNEFRINRERKFKFPPHTFVSFVATK